MPNPNAKLQSILVDAFVGTYPTDTYENIKLSDLSGSAFSFNNIKLSTVIGESSSNPIINTLINNGSSIGSISTDIDALKLYDVYGKNCFVPYDSSLHAGMLRYNQIKDTNGKVVKYYQNDNGAFVLSSTSGIWSLLCFDYDYENDVIADGEHEGRLSVCTVSNLTIKDLQQSNNSNSVSQKITNATIRQLVDAGILENANPLLYRVSLQTALKPIS
jgi:hypothetical protein